MCFLFKFTGGLIRISPLRDLLTHFRYFLNLRSGEGHYHPLILFRLSSSTSDGSSIDNGSGNEGDRASCQAAPMVDVTNAHQIYAMEANCPHLGADMSHADIEECDTGVIAVCPWHRCVIVPIIACTNRPVDTFCCRYDFNLRTGESQTGMKACTYNVYVQEDPKDGTEKVYMEAPQSGRNWRVVELRPVSDGRYYSLFLSMHSSTSPFSLFRSSSYQNHAGSSRGSSTNNTS